MKTSVGRIVHYRVSPHDCIGSKVPGRIGEVRAAEIVNAWGGQEDVGSTPNLMVKPDGGNDGVSPDANGTYGALWLTSVPFDAAGEKPGHWFWPPRV